MFNLRATQSLIVFRDPIPTLEVSNLPPYTDLETIRKTLIKLGNIIMLSGDQCGRSLRRVYVLFESRKVIADIILEDPQLHCEGRIFKFNILTFQQQQRPYSDIQYQALVQNVAQLLIEIEQQEIDPEIIVNTLLDYHQDQVLDYLKNGDICPIQILIFKILSGDQSDLKQQQLYRNQNSQNLITKANQSQQYGEHKFKTYEKVKRYFAEFQKLPETEQRTILGRQLLDRVIDRLKGDREVAERITSMLINQESFNINDILELFDNQQVFNDRYEEALDLLLSGKDQSSDDDEDIQQNKNQGFIEDRVKAILIKLKSNVALVPQILGKFINYLEILSDHYDIDDIEDNTQLSNYIEQALEIIQYK